MDMRRGLPFGKPKPRAKRKPKPLRRCRVRRSKAKAKARRLEVEVIAEVRPLVVERDGHCRLLSLTSPVYAVDAMLKRAFGPCSGPSEWNHYGENRRSNTRGKSAEERHTTAGTMMNCERHHDDIDEHRIDVEDLTERGADGRLRFTHRASGLSYEEPVE
jgi:hypothetical protein